MPHMGLQPLVENAVRHGIGCIVPGGIDVRASRVGSELHIIVKNNGGGSRAGSPPGWGLGMVEPGRA